MTSLSTENVPADTRSNCRAWISPGWIDNSSVSAPAPYRAPRGCSSSTRSTPSVARIATRLPLRSRAMLSPRYRSDSLGCTGGTPSSGTREAPGGFPGTGRWPDTRTAFARCRAAHRLPHASAAAGRPHPRISWFRRRRPVRPRSEPERIDSRSWSRTPEGRQPDRLTGRGMRPLRHREEDKAHAGNRNIQQRGRRCSRC